MPMPPPSPALWPSLAGSRIAAVVPGRLHAHASQPRPARLGAASPAAALPCDATGSPTFGEMSAAADNAQRRRAVVQRRLDALGIAWRAAPFETDDSAAPTCWPTSAAPPMRRCCCSGRIPTASSRPRRHRQRIRQRHRAGAGRNASSARRCSTTASPSRSGTWRKSACSAPRPMSPGKSRSPRCTSTSTCSAGATRCG